MFRLCKKLLLFLFNNLLPHRCGLCDEIVDGNGMLCSKCFSRLKFIGKPCCSICGKPFEYEVYGEGACAECLKCPPLYQKARSALEYNEISKQLVLAFKYGDRLDLLPLFVKFLSQNWKEIIDETDVIVAVPLHVRRLIKRQYNQSEMLGMALAKKFSKEMAFNTLKRYKATKSQGHMNPKERKQNVHGVFFVKHSEKIQGKRVLLIDDVLTTGATVNECSKTLLKAGAISVSVLTLCRVVHPQ